MSWCRTVILGLRHTAFLSLLLLGGCPDSSSSSFDVAADLEIESEIALEEVSVVAPVCPPSAPFGLTKGDRVEPLEFLNGKGDPVTLHSHCGRPLTLVYHFYGW
jgi:hypothetical protein